MARFTVFTLFVIYQLTAIPTPIRGILCDKESSNAERALKKHLFCNGYKPTEHPNKNAMEKLDIYTYVITGQYHFEEYDNTLDMFALFGMHWTDTNLEWNASDWSEIDQIVPKHDEIWVPHFEIINNQHSSWCVDPICNLHYDGFTHCLSICTVMATCSTDWSRWPYDVRTCKMWVSRRTEETTDDRNHFNPTVLCSSINASLSQGDWKLITLTHNQSTLNGPSTANQMVEEYHITLQRNANSALVSIYSPALALALLNLFICWLRSTANERVILLVVSMLSHCELLRHVAGYLEFNRLPLPSAATILIASIVMTFILFVITLANRWLHNRQDCRVVADCFSNISHNRVIRRILQADWLNLEEKMPGAVQNAHSVEQDCQRLAKLIDRGVLMAFVIIYLILLGVFTPVGYIHSTADSDVMCHTE